MNITDAAFLTSVMDLLVDTICVVNVEGRFVFVSAACRQTFGYTPAEMIGQPMIDFVHPDDRARTLARVDNIYAGTKEPHFENRYVRKDGSTVHIMWSARWSPEAGVRVAVARDVTERKRAESMQAALYAVSEAAHTAEDLLALFRHVHQIVGGLLPAVNFFVALYDKAADELSFPYYVDAQHEAPAPRPLDSGTLSAEVIRSGQAMLLRADTALDLPPRVKLDVGRNSLDWLGVPLQTQQGPIGVLVVQSYTGDVRYTERDLELLQFVSTQVATAIERKQMDARLRHIARHDPLTDLPNRTLLHERIQAALQHARDERRRMALLYVDLDMFKEVNDRFGHSAGDLLLQETAVRLRRGVAQAGMVGRIGGDEFLVLLDSDCPVEQTLAIAESLRSHLSEPFTLAGDAVTVSPSIGIALYPAHGDEYQQLIRCADEAMYAAKTSGGNRVRLAGGPVAPD
ncbi:sensor domain-containing protein [Variovorax arabinosiphilus]|uniref:sensor domain-containing protein n=1 Tax=Variovorax arabinosiphilus TaxID=3053498 RepID=UPI002575DB01|nr:MULTISPECIES: diguanylate cyclase [unclassified Variovorax]MDM0118621.1 diguanylate cyclase [Variovorax sp. J2L1-78]MDM0129046.1 diguanylate cyclase [Variovorax sp. J2L1-63]MDM0233167.1 diguanylate cyclase [Variovorax sp. J2R1-6]